MKRKLFCEISPFCYQLSKHKENLRRKLSDSKAHIPFALKQNPTPLEYLIYQHSSLIRRTLGNTDARLQENKSVNLALSAPKINGIFIFPQEVFSFWRLVGDCKAKDGYQEGLVIKHGVPDKGIGGGMCQMTNLIHFLVLHSPLTIIEHHHHDQLDLFPDFNRQVPFGLGTSIAYNNLDYRFRNDTKVVYQLLLWTDDKYLHGQLRANYPLAVSYHIKTENEHFSQEADQIYRNNRIYRHIVDKKSGNLLKKELIKTNHARVMYPITL